MDITTADGGRALRLDLFRLYTFQRRCIIYNTFVIPQILFGNIEPWSSGHILAESCECFARSNILVPTFYLEVVEPFIGQGFHKALSEL
jgi:hypothetical protein